MTRDLRIALVAPLLGLLTLPASSGCSLLIDSDEFVAPRDAGSSDNGTGDAGGDDIGSEDGGPVDQGPVSCGTLVCSGSAPYCLAPNFCVECTQNAHCANNVCDPTTGNCVDPSPDCASCNSPGDTCVDFPAAASGKACIRCDRDEDGFTASWNLCNSAAPVGRPRDCNDGDPRAYPGASPVCADGALQGCPAPQFDDLIQHLGGNVVEFGRTQAFTVANGINLNAQLSTLAMDPAVGIENEDPNAARWAFGHLDNGGAHLTTVQERGFDVGAGQFVWNVGGAPLHGSPGWPFDENEVTAFTLDATGETGPGRRFFRFGAAGKINGDSNTVLLAQNTSNPGLIDEISRAAETVGFLPPLAIIGTATNFDLVYRSGSVPGSRMLHSQPEGQTATLPLAPDALAYVFEAEGEHVFYRTNSGAIGYWNGIANAGRTVDMTTTGGNAVGPARFATDDGTTVGLIPYLTGVRVVAFGCPGGVFDNCETVTSDIQAVLPNMTVFDFELRDNVLFVAFAMGDSVMLHVLTLNAGVLSLRTPQALRIIGPNDNNPTLQSVIAVETDIHVGPNHMEIVVGATAATTGGPTAAIVATGLRACTAL